MCSRRHPTLFAQAETGPGRVVYELGRLREFDDVRLPMTLSPRARRRSSSLVWYLYRRDTRELPRGVGLLLAGLRFVALAGLLVFFLGVERRTTREVVHNSQVAVLVDVSQSMAPLRRRCRRTPSEPHAARAGGRRARQDAARERAAASTTT